MPILSNLNLPQHIGFIMDGNRRFARNLNEPPITGHRMGFDSLSAVLLWCFELGVREVSVFAFSVDNFSRPHEEVNYLMELAIEKVNLMCEPDSFVMRHGIRVKICGDVMLLPTSVREAFNRIEKETSHHHNGQFNIMFAYSSKLELSQAVATASHFEEDSEETDDSSGSSDKGSQITWSSIESEFYNKTPLDLLIRTSGETRLSDFMIWQIKPRHTLILFEKGMWPSYNLAAFVVHLLRYNVHATCSTG